MGDPGAGARVDLRGVGLCFRSYAHEGRNLKTAVLSKVTGSRRGSMSTGWWLYRGLNMTIGHGARLGVIGRNGCGKSTLLRMIAGMQGDELEG